jgi:rhodanese-related sulfurtransferase
MKTTDRPTLQDFHVDGVMHINPLDALEALQNGDAVMIDVREISEVQLESVPLDRVMNHPMSVILERLPYISKDQNIIVACSGGMRSARVVSLLMQYGYENVASLDGGLNTWKAKGLPMTGNTSSGGCCCGSGIKPKATILKTKSYNLGNIDYKSVRMI